ncbi:MAG TPA: porin, partial [Gammaproteobacteria bacterium]
PQMSAKGGLFLTPVGILNETHEPPTFYGVERNPVEKQIIPATWWEAGAAFNHRMGSGLAYDLALHSGLYSDDYNIRGGRQKVAKAKADALAYTARIQWSGIPGLVLAASLNHQSDIRQGTTPEKVSADLLETHAIYTTGSFSLRALYAQWQLDDDGTAAGQDEQHGWYIEPGYKLSQKWGLFARYNIWDMQAGDEADSEYQQSDLGINYWPHRDVVIKLDYQDQSVPDGQDEFDGINLGIGYQF